MQRMMAIRARSTSTRLAAWTAGLAAVLVLLSGTSCTRVIARSELDALNRSIEVQTILLEDQYSLYSPYSASASAGYRRLIDEEHGALSHLFGFELQEPVLIQLVPVADLVPTASSGTGNVYLHARETRPVVGYASQREIVVYVAPSQSFRLPGYYRNVIRHELAHIFVHTLDLPADSWIQEGIAEAVETFMLTEAGELDRDTQLRISRRRLRRWQPLSMARVLDWAENGRRVEQGVERADVQARKLAMTLVRFLVERQGDVPFTAALQHIGSLERSELESLEPEWQAWLKSRVPHRKTPPGQART